MEKIKEINVGTLNVRGCKQTGQIQAVAEDALRYKIGILGITETHTGKDNVEVDVTAKYEKQKQDYVFYQVGKNIHHGVGLLIKKEMCPVFKKISDRICKAMIKTENDDHVIIILCAYAPTMEVSEKDPQQTEIFYEQLDRELTTINKSKHTIILLGDFNAKTGSGYKDFKQNMGKYGKGKLNENGRNLLELCKKHDLFLTNTTFKHKLSHRVTWTSPERINNHLHYDGSVRKNPYRNQIDYVIMKCNHRQLVKNSRSYNGFKTSTDHKLVKTEIKLDWWKMKYHKKRNERIDIGKMNEQEQQQKFKQEINNKYQIKETQGPQERWQNIATICKESAKKVLGITKNNKEHQHPELERLSNEQKELRIQIDASVDKGKRIEMKKDRNKIMNKIKSLVKKTENEKLETELKELERHKNDSNKCHQVIRRLQSKKPKKQLIVKNENEEIVSTEKEKATLIAEHFQKTFNDSNRDKPDFIEPTRMEKEFNSDEIEKAAKELKNGKSTGCDEVHAEYIKYAPQIIHKEIAQIINDMAETGNYPSEIKQGILIPIPKPKKKEEPKFNLRPIILLSIIRKITAICLIDRVWNRLKPHIPDNQAAYQSGRSTTEQVFTIKILAEKAIISSDYTIYLLMLDMSKAFDTVDRKTLLNELSKILNKDELHLMYMLITDVKLKVKVGDEESGNFPTNVGVCQGNCLSALLFVFYLAKAMIEMPKNTIEEDHKDKIQWSALDWVIPKDTHKIEIC